MLLFIAAFIDLIGGKRKYVGVYQYFAHGDCELGAGKTINITVDT